jgi:N-methylhydantoinase A
MRYIGQGWEIPVPVEIRDYDADGAKDFNRLFTDAYVALFGRAIDGLDVEIVSWSLRASSPSAAVERIVPISEGAEATGSGRRNIFEARLDGFAEAKIVERSQLRPGHRVVGPAAIVEAETTTIVSSAYEAIMQPDGCLLLRSRPGGTKESRRT